MKFMVCSPSEAACSLSDEPVLRVLEAALNDCLAREWLA
ncbi:hypothetical protein A2U01_0077698 [Trifolium medium]|uniref:Uncharacterized protein n=1 Tax=Trifolium medium TaxID=97028 RepID=A0A392T7R2_9FABA|nr:hypothetical protein [Trifolium medium]